MWNILQMCAVIKLQSFCSNVGLTGFVRLDICNWGRRQKRAYGKLILTKQVTKRAICILMKLDSIKMHDIADLKIWNINLPKEKLIISKYQQVSAHLTFSPSLLEHFWKDVGRQKKDKHLRYLLLSRRRRPLSPFAHWPKSQGINGGGQWIQCIPQKGWDRIQRIRNPIINHHRQFNLMDRLTGFLYSTWFGSWR